MVTSFVSDETPWKPATSAILPASSAVTTRCGLMLWIFAFVCDASVSMPACEPVSETASWPRSWIAIATSAHEMRSPVDSSMSISRGFGAGDTSVASEISWSVVLPIADTVPTTRRPRSFASTSRRATFLTFSASATDEPPNFITTVSNCGAASAMADPIVPEARRPALQVAPAAQGAADRHLVRELQVAADGQPAREPRDPRVRRAAASPGTTPSPRRSWSGWSRR